MRISLLLDREPFGDILEKTLAYFLDQSTGTPHRVRWYEQNPGSRSIGREGYQPWFCNIYLNAIFTQEAEEGVFDPVRSEYSRSPLWWRRPAQKVYVGLATHGRTSTWLAQSALGISPPLKSSESLLIMGGNQRLRIFNRRENRVYALRKAGFPETFMAREVALRKGSDLPAPALIECGPANSWFSEEYTPGTPLNRISNHHRSRELFGKLLQSFHPWLLTTREETGLLAYAESLVSTARGYLTQNRLIPPDTKDRIQRYEEEIVNGLDKAAQGREKSCFTSRTHGDFQPANILTDGNRAWLIDFEYTNCRQIGYDGLVYLLGSRFPAGLSQRIGKIFSEDHGEGFDLLKGWPDHPWQDRDWRRISLLLFLLEEISLRLEVNANPLFRKPDVGFSEFLNEVEPALTLLSR